MTRSITAVLLGVALAACAQPPAEPPPVAPPDSPVLGLAPYCGPVWSVGKQAYVDIPCPPGSNYPGAR